MGVEVRVILNDDIKQQISQLDELFKLGFIQQSEYDSRKNELLVDPLTPFLRKEGDLSVVTYSKDSLVYDNANYAYTFQSEHLRNEETRYEDSNVELSEASEVLDDHTEDECECESYSEEEEEYVIYGEEETPIDTFTDEQYESSEHKRYGVLSHVWLPERVKVDRFIKPNRSRFRKSTTKQLQKNDSASDCEWIQNSQLPKEIKVAPWSRPGKPTHFLSLRIKSLQTPFSNYQRILRMKYPWASRFLISPVKFHITLGVLDLSRPGTMKVAIEAVKRLGSVLNYAQPLKIAFQGISQFGNCVLHVKVQDDTIIRDIANRIHSELKSKMLVTGKFAEFDPHVTLLKVRKNFQKKETVSLVNECSIGKEKDLYFGEEEFVEIGLNTMEEVDDDGYYETITSVVFVQ